MTTSKEDFQARLEVQIERQPIFPDYPPVKDLETAIEIALEQVEEIEYAVHPHAWCHHRPTILTLLKAAVETLED